MARCRSVTICCVWRTAATEGRHPASCSRSDSSSYCRRHWASGSAAIAAQAGHRVWQAFCQAWGARAEREAQLHSAAARSRAGSSPKMSTISSEGRERNMAPSVVPTNPRQKGGGTRRRRRPCPARCAGAGQLACTLAASPRPTRFGWAAIATGGGPGAPHFKREGRWGPATPQQLSNRLPAPATPLLRRRAAKPQAAGPNIQIRGCQAPGRVLGQRTRLSCLVLHQSSCSRRCTVQRLSACQVAHMATCRSLMCTTAAEPPAAYVGPHGS